MPRPFTGAPAELPRTPARASANRRTLMREATQRAWAVYPVSSLAWELDEDGATLVHFDLYRARTVIERIPRLPQQGFGTSHAAAR
jgi:hypothetical protein